MSIGIGYLFGEEGVLKFLYGFDFLMEQAILEFPVE